MSYIQKVMKHFFDMHDTLALFKYTSCVFNYNYYLLLTGRATMCCTAICHKINSSCRIDLLKFFCVGLLLLDMWNTTNQFVQTVRCYVTNQL